MLCVVFLVFHCFFFFLQTAIILINILYCGLLLSTDVLKVLKAENISVFHLVAFCYEVLPVYSIDATTFKSLLFRGGSITSLCLFLDYFENDGKRLKD